jgi:hypothetical protein
MDFAGYEVITASVAFFEHMLTLRFLQCSNFYNPSIMQLHNARVATHIDLKKLPFTTTFSQNSCSIQP